MTAIYNIPLKVGIPQSFEIELGGTRYRLTFQYRNDPAGGWVLDISDTQLNPILQGIPLITGANLLDQYRYLGFGGGLWVQSQAQGIDPDAVPTFDNLGDAGLIYWVTA